MTNIKKVHTGDDYVRIEIDGVEVEVPKVVGNNILRAIVSLVAILKAYA